MILAFTGHLGAGKTLGLTYWAWRMSYAAGGLPVQANYPIQEDYFAPHREWVQRFWSDGRREGCGGCRGLGALMSRARGSATARAKAQGCESWRNRELRACWPSEMAVLAV